LKAKIIKKIDLLAIARRFIYRREKTPHLGVRDTATDSKTIASKSSVKRGRAKMLTATPPITTQRFS